MAESAHRTILLVDDEDDLREVLTDFLISAGFTVVTASNGKEALARLNGVPPDLVVLDLMLPDISGFDVCRQIKSKSKNAYLPVILLTARGDLESLVDGLGSAQADDYVVKPFKNRELLARIGACLRVKDLHDVVLKQNEMLTELSATDDLTGMFNRRFLTRKLEENIQRLRQEKGVAYFALIDLDHFKEVNDRLGHLCGDEILRRFGQTLKNSVGAAGLCGRWGGDEFFVIFPVDAADTAAAETRIHGWTDAILSAIKNDIVRENIPVGISGGIAAVSGPDARLDAEQLMMDLDKLLYSAKREGRKRFVFGEFNRQGRRPHPAPAPDRSRPLIYILEDDEDICAVMEDMLSRQNVDARIFQRTPALMAAVAEKKPDLICLDMRLSDADGMDVCRELRSNPKLAGLRIAFVTGFTSEEVRLKAMACGADAILFKPFTYSKFISQIQQILNLAR